MFPEAGTTANQVPTFTITYTKLYVPVVTLSTQDNIKLLKQLESGYKRTINWNKYQFKKAIQVHHQYLDFLIDPSVEGANRFFVFSFQNEMGRENYNRYYLSIVEIKNYSAVIYGRNFFDQPVKMMQL